MTAPTVNPPRSALITGFGPFGEITDNPSGRNVIAVRDRLAERLPHWILEAKTLPVTPGVIEPFLGAGYTALLCLGVDASSAGIRIEREARNFFWDRFSEKEGKAIEEGFPETLARACGPLLSEWPETLEGFSVSLGGPESAGTYVCNDTLFRAAGKHPRSYFVHVPAIGRGDDPRLVAALTEILERILKGIDQASAR